MFVCLALISQSICRQGLITTINHLATSMALLRLNFSALILSYISLITFTSHSQTVVLNHAVLDSSINNSLRLYKSQVGPNSLLYYGAEYKEFPLDGDDTGNPYFLLDDWGTGSINFNGHFFDDVSLKYDIVQDKALLENPYTGNTLEMMKARVSKFSLEGHYFVNLLSDSVTAFGMNSGFYEVLYDGKTKVLARHIKTIQTKIDQGVKRTFFEENNTYFVCKDNGCFQVKNKATVLAVFKDKKQMLAKEMAKSKVSFKENREHAISTAARLYDNLDGNP